MSGVPGFGLNLFKFSLSQHVRWEPEGQKTMMY